MAKGKPLARGVLLASLGRAFVVRVGPPFGRSVGFWVVPCEPPVLHLQGWREVSRAKRTRLKKARADSRWSDEVMCWPVRGNPIGSAVTSGAESLGAPGDQSSGEVASSATGTVENLCSEAGAVVLAKGHGFLDA